MADYILALDEGTSSARTVLFDQEAQEVAAVQKTFSSSFPQPGWVEQNPFEIWQTQASTLRDICQTVSTPERSIHALGLTNQRETTLIWDRNTGIPIAPAIVWQCRRTADLCETIKRTSFANQIQAITGLVVDAYFSATKIVWLLEHVPDARTRAESGELAFGTVDTWLIYQLTGKQTCVMDRTNASRTMLMDLATGSWSMELLDYFSIPPQILPDIVPSTGICGMTAGDVVGVELPIAGIAGDQQAALVGQGCDEAGMAKNTYGTGCFLLMNTGTQISKSSHQLLSTAAASLDVNKLNFALEGSVFDAGTVMQWLRDEMQLFDVVSDSAAIAESVPSTEGVRMVPAFSGLGAPYWQPNVRGAILGLSRGTTKAHLVRAALESIAYQTAELMAAMEADSDMAISELKVDGGAAANDFLMQFQADLLGIPVIRPSYLETTVRGAALLAGFATGFYSELPSELHSEVFEPQWSEARRQEEMSGWRQVVEQIVPNSE